MLSADGQGRSGTADHPHQPGDVAVSVLIVHFNTPDLLEPLFAALMPALAGLRHEIVFVDNASRADCHAQVAQLAPQAVFVQNERNVGFGRANNQALALSQGRFVLLLNTDAFVAPDTIRKTLEYMRQDPACGILGVKLVGRDGVLQPSCRYFPTPLNQLLARTRVGRFLPLSRPVDDMEWAHDLVRECDWVPGCYYLVRREVLDQVGLFDPRFFMYYEEVDHCRAAKKRGWKVVFYPHTQVVHLGGESAKNLGKLTARGQQVSAVQMESELLYFRKQYALFGVVMHLLLLSVGNLYSGVTGLLRRREAQSLKEGLGNIARGWQLFFQTRLGRVATR